MAKLTLSQAAKAYGKSKGTISKALHSGRLSGEKRDDGSWCIDVSELERWVGTTRPANTSRGPISTPELNSIKPIANGGIDPRFEIMEERLADAHRTIEDLRARLNAESEERRVLTERLLAAPQKPAERPVGWLGRLLGQKS